MCAIINQRNYARLLNFHLLYRYKLLPNRQGGVSGFGVAPASRRPRDQDNGGGGGGWGGWGRGQRLGNEWILRQTRLETLNSTCAWSLNLGWYACVLKKCYVVWIGRVRRAVKVLIKRIYLSFRVHYLRNAPLYEESANSVIKLYQKRVVYQECDTILQTWGVI